MISVIFILMTFIQGYIGFRTASSELNDNMNIVIESLKDRLSTIDRLYYVLEQNVDQILREKLEMLQKIYDDNGNIDFDLEKLKDDPFLDFYIINEDYIVAKTTYETDYLLDFKTMNMVEFLNAVKERNEYITDRIAISTLSERLRKYGYWSTKDKKYIFEASYDFEAFNELLGKDNMNHLVSDAFQNADFIESLRVLDYHNRSFGDNYSVNQSNQDHYNAFLKARDEGVNVALNDHYNIIYNRYRFYMPIQLYYEEEKSTAFIIEIVYNDEVRINELILRYAFQIVIIMTFIYLLFQVSKRFDKMFIKPLEIIIQKMKDVSIGNDYTTINIEVKNELDILVTALNKMIKNISDSYQVIQTYNKELEIKVATRTNELQEANYLLNEKIEELNQTQNYLLLQQRTIAIQEVLQEVSHRLNTPLGNALLCISYMQDEINNPKKRSLNKINESLTAAHNSIQSIIDILDILSIIYKSADEESNKEIDLKKSFEISYSNVVQQLDLHHEFMIEGDEVFLDLSHNLIELLAYLIGSFQKNYLKEVRQMKLSFKTDVHTSKMTFVFNNSKHKIQNISNPFTPFSYGNFQTGIEGLELYLLEKLVTINMKGHIQLLSGEEEGLLFSFEKSH